jgi:hypothetical protein
MKEGWIDLSIIYFQVKDHRKILTEQGRHLNNEGQEGKAGHVNVWEGK